MTTYAGMNAETGQWVSDLDHIRQSIRKALTTLFDTRVMRRGICTNIPDLIDQPFNQFTRMQLMSATALAVVTYEPRIKPSKITLSQGSEASAWIVDLTASLRDGINAGQTINLSIPL